MNLEGKHRSIAYIFEENVLVRVTVMNWRTGVQTHLQNFKGASA